MAEFKEGQTARNAKGERIVFKGGEWVRLAPAPGSPVAARKMSKEEQNELNKQNMGAAAGLEAKQRVAETLPAAKRLRGGPWRGAFLDAAIDNGGGFWDTLGAYAIGAPMRLIGAIPQRDVEDYQTVQRNALLSTRQSETGEKGTQTEGDAARSLAATISARTADPTGTAAQVIGKADRQQKRAYFYTKWANQYGLNNTDEKGRGVEEAFMQSIGSAAPKSGGGVRIKRIK